MSRRCTLDEYLEGVVDEHTESAEEEMRLLVTDAQVHAVGLFFIDGMVGLIQCLRNEREAALPRETKGEQSDVVTDEVAADRDDFIN
ncbi:MAG TPA: hypothetical protein VGO68_00245 [Pyrinomonadaceae bacterium]|jgi:hypothetical protein|nr:hypothetical protein [Pyrinomonadaceae bacterium]